MALVSIPQLFVILGQGGDWSKLASAIQSTYPNDHLALAPGQWLIVSSGETTMELSERLGITDGSAGSAVVIAGSGGYYGRANPGIWEWLRARMGNSRG